MPDKENLNNIKAVSMSKYNVVNFTEKEDRGGWVSYGDYNLLPQYLLELGQESPLHGVLCSSISQDILGKGFTSMLPATRAAVAQLKINKKSLPLVAHDLKKFGGYYLEVVWTIDHTKVGEVNCIPFENVRVAYDKKLDAITGVYVSIDWANYRKPGNTPKYLPLFNVQKAKEIDGDGVPLNEDTTRQVLIKGMLSPGSYYYPRPDYHPGLNYIELDRQIGSFHCNNIKNGMFPSHHVKFRNGIPSPEQQEVTINDWENNTRGTENAGVRIFSFNEPDRETVIEAFPLSDADKQYEFLSEESMLRVMQAHRITSTLLIGLREGGGFSSNTDELKTAHKLYMQRVVGPFQELIIEGYSEVLAAAGVVPQIEIEQNDVPYAETEIDKPTATTDAPTADPNSPDLASTALNGAQIESLLNIVLQASAGVLSIGTAKAVAKAGFPMLTEAQINSIFNGVTTAPTSVDPEQVLRQLRAIKLNSRAARIEMTDDDSKYWTERLKTLGEVVDLDEWELVEESVVESPEKERELFGHLLSKGRVALASLDSYANGGDKSDWGDAGLYKLRYGWSQNISEDSRPICKDMVALSLAGKVYRYEDIQAMSADGVNSQFAPAGQSTYDIFKWKGGVYCHHYWKRYIYFRKRGKNGAFLPNKGLENDKRVANNPYVPPKGDEGVAPIDTSTRGSLKN